MYPRAEEAGVEAAAQSGQPQATAGISAGEALNEGPLTGALWKIWFLSAMGVFLDGFDLFVVGVALPFIARDFAPRPVELGLVAAAAPVGAILGTLLGGRLCDRFGRRPVFLIDLGIFIVFAVLSAVSWNIASLLAFRLILGVGVGADYPISATYVSEFMPARLRGRMLVSAFSFQALGSITGAAIGLAILLVYPHAVAWRFMLAAGAVPALVILVLRQSTPESPRWCELHGKTGEAQAICSQLAGRTIEIAQTTERALAWSALYSREFIRRTLLTAVPWFLMDVCLYGIGLFTPVILATLGFGAPPGHTPVSYIANDIHSTQGAVFLDGFLVIGFVLAFWLIDHLGRIRLQMAGFLGMSVGLLLVGIGAALRAAGSQDISLILIGFALFNLMVNMGPNPTTYTLPAEIFPTALRGSGNGNAAAAGKIGAAAGIFLLPILRVSVGLPVLMGVVAGVSILGFLVTWLLGEGIETHHRLLEDIHAMFQRHSAEASTG
jgi:MFS family permease